MSLISHGCTATSSGCRALRLARGETLDLVNGRSTSTTSAVRVVHLVRAHLGLFSDALALERNRIAAAATLRRRWEQSAIGTRRRPSTTFLGREWRARRTFSIPSSISLRVVAAVSRLSHSASVPVVVHTPRPTCASGASTRSLAPCTKGTMLERITLLAAASSLWSNTADAAVDSPGGTSTSTLAWSLRSVVPVARVAAAAPFDSNAVEVISPTTSARNAARSGITTPLAPPSHCATSSQSEPDALALPPTTSKPRL